MIIKNISINISAIILIFICFITGLVKDIIAIYSLVLFHELGHILISSFFKWKISKVNIYAFGAVTIFNDKIDKPLLEEFLVTLFGPLFQIILYLIYFILNKNLIISDYYFELIKNYNYSILLFNLIPIIPLDGSKLLNVILNKFLNFRVSYILIFITSIFNLIIFVLINVKNTSYIIIISFLLSEILKYYKNKNIIFNRFILEKYLYSNNYKKYKRINNLKQMKRNRKHLVKYHDNYISEKNAIKKIKEYNS